MRLVRLWIAAEIRERPKTAPAGGSAGTRTSDASPEALELDADDALSDFAGSDSEVSTRRKPGRETGGWHLAEFVLHGAPLRSCGGFARPAVCSLRREDFFYIFVLPLTYGNIRVHCKFEGTAVQVKVCSLLVGAEC